MKRGEWKRKAELAVWAAIAGAGVVAWGLPGEDRAQQAGLYALPEVPAVSVQELRDGMIMPHFAKIAGIAEQFQEDGVLLPPNLDIRVRYAIRMSDTKHAQYEGNEEVQIAFDMARSEGAMEAREGEWSVESLANYVDNVMELDQRFVRVAEAASAYLQEEGVSAEDAVFYIRQSIGLAYHDHLHPSNAGLEGGDDRLRILEEEHSGVVMDLHRRMYDFFQHRLRELDVADERFMLSAEGHPFLDVSAETREIEDETPGMDL